MKTEFEVVVNLYFEPLDLRIIGSNVWGRYL